MKKKVYYHDTDCGGVVYYGRYLEFLEEARTEHLFENGLLTQELMKNGVYFVVSHVEVDYKYPARYGDILDVRASIKSFTRTSMEFFQEIHNQNNQLVIEAKVRLVCIDKNFKPQPLSEEIKQRLGLLDK